MWQNAVPTAPAQFLTGQVKVNGVVSGGNVVIGHFLAVAPVVLSKQNLITSAAGDCTVAPVTYAVVSDPDWIDAPLCHAGFF